MNVDTPLRTLAVAAAVALVCSILVASAVQLLRPLAPVEAFPARALAVLEAAGRLPASERDEAILSAAYRALDARIVDLDSGEFVDDGNPYTFDPWTSDSPTRTTELTRAPVYLARDGSRLERIVLPVHGPGMWSTIYGYVALEGDLDTVASLVIVRHGETPGIGDRIEEKSWQARWKGKRIYGDGAKPRIAVVPDARGEHEVDLISGASVTVEAVGDFVREAFGPDGYGPFVERFGGAAEN